MGTLWQDIRYGIRMLSKSPGFTAIALITLAIGIGANTIMFSLVNVLLLRPSLVKEPDRLVECYARNFQGGLPYTVYLDLQDNNQVFSDLVAFGDMDEATLAQGNFTRRIFYMHVSANYFSTLGITPTLGGPFLPEEEKPDAQAVAVMSHHYWKRQGSDPEILGKHMLLNGVPVQVVGFAPEHTVSVRVDTKYLPLPERIAYYDRLVEEVTAVPGIESVGLSDTQPLGSKRAWSVEVTGNPDERRNRSFAYLRVVDHHYLQTLRIGLHAGRYFDERYAHYARRTVHLFDGRIVDEEQAAKEQIA